MELQSTIKDDRATMAIGRRRSVPSAPSAARNLSTTRDVASLSSASIAVTPEVDATMASNAKHDKTTDGNYRPPKDRRKGVYEFINVAFRANEENSESNESPNGESAQLQTERDISRSFDMNSGGARSKPVVVNIKSSSSDFEPTGQESYQYEEQLEGVSTEKNAKSIFLNDNPSASSHNPKGDNDNSHHRHSLNNVGLFASVIREGDEAENGVSNGGVSNSIDSQPIEVTSTKRRRGIPSLKQVSWLGNSIDSFNSSSGNKSAELGRNKPRPVVVTVDSHGMHKAEADLHNQPGHGPDQSIVFNVEENIEVRSEENDDVKLPRSNSELTFDSNTEDATLHLASIYVTDCIHSREEDFLRDRKSIRYYEIYNHFVLRFMIIVSGWVLLCMALFEDPPVTPQPAPVWVTVLIELIIMCIFTCRLVHRYLFTGASVFLRKNWQNIVIIVAIALTVIDIVAYLLWVHLATADMALNAVRWSRPIRPIFLVMFPESRWICKGFFNICRTLPDVIHILVLWLASMLLFSLAAYKMFKDKNFTYPNGAPYFSTYFDSFWDMYTCITTANNPDVMMPIYDVNDGIVLFFVLHVVTNLYIFLYIVLATIYNNFKEHVKNDVRATVYMYRRLLLKAFNLLSVRVGNGVFAVTADRWKQLIGRLCPEHCSTKVDFMFYLLDENHSDMIEKHEFLQLRDLFTVQIVEVKPKKTFLESHCGAIYNSNASVKLRSIITSRYFMYLFDILILVNIVAIGLDITSIWWFFLAMFTLEVLAYMYANGPVKFFTFKMNIFDFILIVAAWVTTIGKEVLTDPSAKETDVNLLLIIRLIRVVRVAHNFGRFRIVLTTISKLLPFFIQYGSLLMFLFYVYAIMCMDIFKGKVKFFGPVTYVNLTNETNFCGNPALEGSDFFALRYCKNNFNNILSAYVVLYDLMVVNQWQVTSSGFILSTNISFRIFFISFHIVCVLIFLNIFAALFLEVYSLVLTLTTNKVELRIETKAAELRNGLARSQTAENLRRMASTISLPTSSSDPDVNVTAASGSRHDLRTISYRHRTYAELGGKRFKLKKNKSMQLDLILQQLFENEIDPTDIGDRVIDEAEAAQSRMRRMTLSAI